MCEQNLSPDYRCPLEQYFVHDLTRGLTLANMVESHANDELVTASKRTTPEEVLEFFKEAFYVDKKPEVVSLNSQMVNDSVRNATSITDERWEWPRLNRYEKVRLIKYTGQNYRLYVHGGSPGLCLALFEGVGPDTKMYI